MGRREAGGSKVPSRLDGVGAEGHPAPDGKAREAFADALARLLFDKRLVELDRCERAELTFLRAIEDAAADEQRYQQLAAEHPEDPGDATVH
jgi:hypothetical protein